jgi:hypothetical protein
MVFGRWVFGEGVLHYSMVHTCALDGIEGPGFLLLRAWFLKRSGFTF